MTINILNIKSEISVEICEKTNSWGGYGKFEKPPSSLLPNEAVFVKDLGHFYIRNFNENTLEFDVYGTGKPNFMKGV